VALTTDTEKLFGGNPDAPKLSPADVTRRLDSFLEKLDAAPTRHLGPQDVVSAFAGGRGIDFSEQPSTAYGVLTKALDAPSITKGLSGEALASITGALEQLKSQQPDLVKDITSTSPVGTGLVAFDLEAPSFS
jgi:hypothetical protein